MSELRDRLLGLQERTGQLERELDRLQKELTTSQRREAELNQAVAALRTQAGIALHWYFDKMVWIIAG